MHLTSSDYFRHWRARLEAEFGPWPHVLRVAELNSLLAYLAQRRYIKGTIDYRPLFGPRLAEDEE